MADINLKTPLLLWLAAYGLTGDMQVGGNGKDYRLGAAASARIAVGISDVDHRTYIGIAGGDDVPLGSFPIASIAFAREIQGRDWLVIVTDDASDGRAKKPVPMRLWFPANSGRFDPWCGIGPHATAALVRIGSDQIPVASEKGLDEIGEYPLTLQGNWQGVEVIEDADIEEEPTIITAAIPMPDTGEDDMAAELEAARAALSGEGMMADLHGVDIDAIMNGGHG